ncbi:proteasomal ATPase-associated factor 1-like [Saccoglossus kowalevskii]
MAARLILQCDWSDALKQAEGRAWISCSKIDCPTVHGELKSHGLNSNGIPHVVPTEGFTVDKITKRSITVSYPDANITTKFVMPLTAFSAIHKKQITSMDISSGGALGVSAAMDGQLLIWQTSDGSIRRDLKGHLGDVNCCRFFPSGVVVLSGGSDMMLKIWSAEDGKCPVTLKGHKGGITDTAMVDRGRNVVSCSRDGTAKLWDCGQSKCLATIECGCIVNSCDLGEANNAVSLGTVQGIANEREVGTEGKLLLLAREDGILQGVGLQSRQSIFEIPGTDSFNCCCMLSTSQVIGGTQDGRIYIIDIRNTRFLQ